jgi:small subunit ribosomal protein S17
MSQASTPTDAPARGRRKTEVGVVASDKMDKTRRVEIERLVPHPKYGKYVRKRTVCHAHDETNETRVGDMVEIMETRPLSKLKRWRIVRVVRKAPQQALVGEGEPPHQPETAPSQPEASPSNPENA